MLNNFRPVSLLPVCGKILERSLFNKLFKFFIENKLISSNQSGFKPDYSCVKQLLSVTDEMDEPFDVGLEITSVSVDISKAFDKMWGDGIIS